MKAIHILRYTLLFSFLICGATQAQRKLDFTVKYDQEFDRYEVYAKPNFSQRNFTWGPSQITLVIPSNVLVDKLKIANVDGGAWDDNSVIQAPEITPDFSYHGVSTSGNKTDLTEGHESVLFYFSLPQKVNPAKVRVFNNETDPNSAAKGMLGGDFRNTVVDMTGKDWFSEVYANKTIEKTTKSNIETADFDAVVYPNVVVDNKFKVTLNNLKEDDGDVLMILTDELGKEFYRQRGTKSSLEKQVVNLPKTQRMQGLVVRFITSKGSVSKRILTE
jgi:hypothetical protein